MLLASLFVFICGTTFSAMSTSYMMLIGIRVITALSAALFIVVTLSTAARLAHPAKQGRILGLVYMGFSGANVFGVPLGTYIGFTFGWRSTFWLITVLSIICFVLIALFLPKTEGANEKESIPFNTVFKNRQIRTLLIITTIVLAAHYIVYAYISPLMTGAGYTLSTVSLILLIAGVAGTSGTIIGGSMADLVGSKRTLLAACTLFIISMLFLHAALPFIFLFSMVVFVWNFVQWSTSPAIQYSLININPKAAELALSLNMSALNIGIGLGALVGGIINHNGGLDYAHFISATMVLIPILLLLYLKEDVQK